ncbi:MAG: hypothetical protein ACFE0I_16835 [Elainellaceae cyanobacterium]
MVAEKTAFNGPLYAALSSPCRFLEIWLHTFLNAKRSGYRILGLDGDGLVLIGLVLPGCRQPERSRVPAASLSLLQVADAVKWLLAISFIVSD